MTHRDKGFENRDRIFQESVNIQSSGLSQRSCDPVAKPQKQPSTPQKPQPSKK